jgi:glutaredoxin 3
MVDEAKMSNITVYSKTNCPYCVKAKALLAFRGKEYTEVLVGVDMLREDFMDTFPDVRTVPFIVIDGVKIGGYDNLVEWLDNPQPRAD